MEPFKKYKPYPVMKNFARSWPDNQIQQAPIWCSVDLRDGNQALATPMSLQEKLEFFNALVKMGFKEIEVGFPSASKIEYDFIRTLIDQKMIPGDVKLQVLVQARQHLIEKTFESLAGSNRPIVHLYNSTSINQRKMVFDKTEDEIIDIALQGVHWIKEQIGKTGLDVQLEYSPESFTGTELEFAARICNAVIDAWKPTPANKLIINLPATMELSTPNVYADRIEWMSTQLKNRENVTISVHAHNDRGTAIAASELALLAGADRVEGTLFGNGERTGNADIVVIALNIYTQGIDPKLKLFDIDIDDIVKMTERINKIPIHQRHPYAGTAVYTAYSGSHQDAISKGLKYQKKHNLKEWEIPYLPIDPSDLGRTYEGIIRINSQSGKGGIAYVLESELGYQLPRDMQIEFSSVIQEVTDSTGKEINSDAIISIFNKTYFSEDGVLKFDSCDLSYSNDKQVRLQLSFESGQQKHSVEGKGNGPLDACKHALEKSLNNVAFNIVDYHEHAIKQGSDSNAIAYIEIENQIDHKRYFGAGIDSNITIAAMKSLFSALNRHLKNKAS